MRGVAIAQNGAVRQLRADVWAVNSQSHKGQYLVDVGSEQSSCTCPDHEEHFAEPDFRCKHAIGVLIVARRIEVPLSEDTDIRRPTYSQDWATYEDSPRHERERFVLLLRDLCRGIATPPQTRGRPRAPLGDVIYAVLLRGYTGMSSRRAHSDVRSAAAAGHIDAAMSSKTVLRYLDNPALTDLLRGLLHETSAPLATVEHSFAVDSTGFATVSYARWFDAKYGKERKRHDWIKVHVCAGTSTHTISDAIITDSSGADAPQLPELVTTTVQRFTVSQVSADKAYGSHRNHPAVDAIGATAWVPFKITSTGQGPELWRKAWGLFMFRNDEFRKHYHARSNGETVFSMIKRKHGASVRAKNFTAQVNEILARLVVHNLVVLVGAMAELGITTEFWGCHER